jgi:hypothetical protein
MKIFAYRLFSGCITNSLGITLCIALNFNPLLQNSQNETRKLFGEFAKLRHDGGCDNHHIHYTHQRAQPCAAFG